MNECAKAWDWLVSYGAKSHDLDVAEHVSFAASMGYDQALPVPAELGTAFLKPCFTLLEKLSSTASLHLTGLCPRHVHAKSLPSMAGLGNTPKALQVQQLSEKPFMSFQTGLMCNAGLTAMQGQVCRDASLQSRSNMVIQNLRKAVSEISGAINACS